MDALYSRSEGLDVAERAGRFDLEQAGPNFLNGQIGEGVATVKVDFRQTLFVDGKGRALTGTVFVDAAHRRPAFHFDQEGAAEEDFAAVAALVAFALEKGDLLGNIWFVKSNE